MMCPQWTGDAFLQKLLNSLSTSRGWLPVYSSTQGGRIYGRLIEKRSRDRLNRLTPPKVMSRFNHHKLPCVFLLLSFHMRPYIPPKPVSGAGMLHESKGGRLCGSAS